jgi:hypothetical protein
VTCTAVFAVILILLWRSAIAGIGKAVLSVLLLLVMSVLLLMLSARPACGPESEWKRAALCR